MTAHLKSSVLGDRWYMYAFKEGVKCEKLTKKSKGEKPGNLNAI
jgi:hypothetical protein